MHLFFAERFGIAFAVPGLDLPAVLAVVRVDPDHSLNLELLAHTVGPLVLLHDDGLEAAAAGKLPGAAQRLYRLDALHSTGCLDVFGDQAIDRLHGSLVRLGENESRHDREQHTTFLKAGGGES